MDRRKSTKISSNYLIDLEVNHTILGWDNFRYGIDNKSVILMTIQLTMVDNFQHPL